MDGEIPALIKEYELQGYEGFLREQTGSSLTEFIREQAGPSLTIAEYLCEALGSVISSEDARNLNRFDLAEALERVAMDKLLPLWDQFIKEEGNEYLDHEREVLADHFWRFLSKEWREDPNVDPGGLVEKIVLVGKHSADVYCLVITVRIWIERAPDDPHWDVRLVRLRLYGPRCMPEGECTDIQICRELKDLQYTALEMRAIAGNKDTARGLLLQKAFDKNQNWREFWKQLLNRRHYFMVWLDKMPSQKSELRRRINRRVILEFQELIQEQGSTLAIPFELACLQDEEEGHKLCEYLPHRLRFIFLDKTKPLAASRRYRRKGRMEISEKPLSLSQLCSKSKSGLIPSVRGHILFYGEDIKHVIEGMEREGEEEPIEQICRTWGSARKVFRSLGPLNVEVVNDSISLLGYLKKEIDEHSWHMVHLIAHGRFNPQNGGVMQLGENRGEISPEDLAGALKGKRIKLILFDFCESAAVSERSFEAEEYSSFIEYFVRRMTIPTLIGFRWRIDAWSASRLAWLFYSKLLLGGSELPVAWQGASAEMKEDSRVDPRVWLSPVLIHQDFSLYPLVE